MKKTSLWLALLLVVFALAACAPGPNDMVKVADSEGQVAGFWLGLWHGFITPFTFIASLFNKNIGVYEVHNNGAWYNFGFLMGATIIFGGGGSGGGSAYSRRQR